MMLFARGESNRCTTAPSKPIWSSPSKASAGMEARRSASTRRRRTHWSARGVRPLRPKGFPNPWAGSFMVAPSPLRAGGPLAVRGRQRGTRKPPRGIREGFCPIAYLLSGFRTLSRTYVVSGGRGLRLYHRPHMESRIFPLPAPGDTVRGPEAIWQAQRQAFPAPRAPPHHPSEETGHGGETVRGALTGAARRPGAGTARSASDRAGAGGSARAARPGPGRGRP